jgi:hypothetical protein
MRLAYHIPTQMAVMALTAVLWALPASATCTRLAFSVNDYGKDGPTKDAKQLLDKYVAKWAAEHGIKKYVAGKKDVSCELFLNFVLFDEHTCKASASVCWEGPAVPGMPGAKPETAAVTPAQSKPKAPVTSTGSIEKPAEKSAAEKTEAAVKKDTPADAKPASEAKKAAPKENTDAAATPADGAAVKKVAPAKTAYKPKAKTLSAEDAAKAAEAAKPKAPLPQKPESAPVQ